MFVLRVAFFVLETSTVELSLSAKRGLALGFFGSEDESFVSPATSARHSRGRHSTEPKSAEMRTSPTDEKKGSENEKQDRLSAFDLGIDSAGITRMENVNLNNEMLTDPKKDENSKGTNDDVKSKLHSDNKKTKNEKRQENSSVLAKENNKQKDESKSKSDQQEHQKGSQPPSQHSDHDSNLELQNNFQKHLAAMAYHDAEKNLTNNEEYEKGTKQKLIDFQQNTIVGKENKPQKNSLLLQNEIITKNDSDHELYSNNNNNSNNNINNNNNNNNNNNINNINNNNIIDHAPQHTGKPKEYHETSKLYTVPKETMLSHLHNKELKEQYKEDEHLKLSEDDGGDEGSFEEGSGGTEDEDGRTQRSTSNQSNDNSKKQNALKFNAKSEESTDNDSRMKQNALKSSAEESLDNNSRMKQNALKYEAEGSTDINNRMKQNALNSKAEESTDNNSRMKQNALNSKAEGSTDINNRMKQNALNSKAEGSTDINSRKKQNALNSNQDYSDDDDDENRTQKNVSQSQQKLNQSSANLQETLEEWSHRVPHNNKMNSIFTKQPLWNMDLEEEKDSGYQSHDSTTKKQNKEEKLSIEKNNQKNDEREYRDDKKNDGDDMNVETLKRRGSSNSPDVIIVEDHSKLQPTPEEKLEKKRGTKLQSPEEQIENKRRGSSNSPDVINVEDNHPKIKLQPPEQIRRGSSDNNPDVFNIDDDPNSKLQPTPEQIRNFIKDLGDEIENDKNNPSEEGNDDQPENNDNQHDNFPMPTNPSKNKPGKGHVQKENTEQSNTSTESRTTDSQKSHPGDQHFQQSVHYANNVIPTSGTPIGLHATEKNDEKVTELQHAPIDKNAQHVPFFVIERISPLINKQNDDPQELHVLGNNLFGTKGQFTEEMLRPLIEPLAGTIEKEETEVDQHGDQKNGQIVNGQPRVVVTKTVYTYGAPVAENLENKENKKNAQMNEKVEEPFM